MEMNMMCSRCKKRMAVIFMTRMEGSNTINEGLCMRCAKELGIQPINEMMEKMGITDETIDAMEEQMQQLQESGELDENAFEMGGAQSLPFIQQLFGGNPPMPNPGALDIPAEPVVEKHREEKKSGVAGMREDAKKKASKRKYLDNFCENLTAKAAAGKVDTVVGREQEIYRVQQILCRRQKNNPCLIGEPGVGKTAIAEGIALRIASGAVPAQLRDKQLYMLDLTALVAGTQFRGQFESRVKGLISDVKKAGNVILFIDEVHSLVGAGGDSEGSMNAANILKPALSRGEVQVIGATTYNEYRKHIEKDAALERRFQPVRVSEPTVEDSVAILQGIKR